MLLGSTPKRLVCASLSGGVADDPSSCITGTGNIFPKTIARLYALAVKGLKGDAAALSEALVLQDRIARSDFIIVKAGIPGTVSDDLAPVGMTRLLTSAAEVRPRPLRPEGSRRYRPFPSWQALARGQEDDRDRPRRGLGVRAVALSAGLWQVFLSAKAHIPVNLSGHVAWQLGVGCGVGSHLVFDVH
jgi:hypothetical protein